MARFIENKANLERFLDQIELKMVQEVEKRAKELVPVDSGKLKRSIGLQKVSKDLWQVFADTSYALYVELGTSKKRARPFLRPALDALRKFTR